MILQELSVVKSKTVEQEVGSVCNLLVRFQTTFHQLREHLLLDDLHETLRLLKPAKPVFQEMTEQF